MPKIFIMKKITLLFFLLISKAVFAQKDTVGLNIPIKDGYVVYEQVVNAPGFSKEVLFSNAKTALVNYFNDIKDAIQNQDKANGQVISKGAITITIKDFLGRTDYFTDRFLVQIDCKENKFRIRVSSQELSNGNEFFTPEQFIGKLTGDWNSATINKKEARRGLIDTDNKILFMLDDLKKSMLSRSNDF